jgi:hypothetical protein
MRFECGTLFTSEAGRAHAQTYAHEYDGFMQFFRLLAHATTPIECVDVPSVWVPFVLWLGHEVVTVETSLRRCEVSSVPWGELYRTAMQKGYGDPRRVVEIASVSQPELVHALYCADTEWPCLLRKREHRTEFAVTCNGSFFRDEVQAYRHTLAKFVPTKRKVVIVPCSAEKPYPALLHRRVQERLPNTGEWYVMIATGVLGLVPDGLWSSMPMYDSGLPYALRCEQTVAAYFSRHWHDAIVVYSDFYANAVHKGLAAANALSRADFVLGHHYRDTYENLLLDEHLNALSVALRSHS